VSKFAGVRFESDIANPRTSGTDVSAMNPSSQGERKP
jgi:hypothetical protein